MPWFKVDDGLADHPKTVMAGNAAMGLWVRAGSWSAKHLTEGLIPAHMIPVLGNRKQADSLVLAGLWISENADFRFHQWNEDGRQPTREAVLAERAAARERQQKARDRARESRRDTPVTHAHVTPAVTVPPTRPDPTRPSTYVDKNELSNQFEAAWELWPKKVDKADAFRRFKTAIKKKPAGDLVLTIRQFGDAYAATTEKQYTPALGAWLNRERWDDELPTASGNRKLTRTEENLLTVRQYAQQEELKELE